MRAWTLALPVDRADPAPVVRQVARGIAAHVAGGRLRPGDRLPGTRALSRVIGVHRNTIAAAYAELAAEGWVDSTPGRGTFVSSGIPAPARGRAPAPARAPAGRSPGYALPPAPPAPPPLPAARGFLNLEGGLPDLRLVPAAELARAYRRALRHPGILGYRDPRGHERLRTAIGKMLGATRALDADPEHLLLARGSQLGLTLVARALVRPGDVVAVEELGYRAAWETFRAAGARLVPLPLDEDGLRVEALEALARRERVRALYLTPHHQYPTTVTLPAGRRLALLRLAAAERIAIVEDDFDSEFHYDGRPVLPLASSDPAGVVVYVGTLSKVLAPGLRLGYVHAPRDTITCLAEHRRYVDRMGDTALELAIAELLEDGEIQQHAWRMRRIYHARRDAMGEALRETLGSVLTFALPQGGMALWARVAEDVDVSRWAAAAREAGVLFEAGQEFAFDGAPRSALRLGFAAEPEKDLREGIRRMAATLPRRRRGRVSGGRGMER